MVALVSDNCFYCCCCQTIGVCFHLILEQHETFLPWLLNLLARLQNNHKTIRGGKILKVFQAEL